MPPCKLATLGFIAAVAVQHHGVLMNLDLAAVEADRDQCFNKGLAVFEARLAFHIV